MACHRATMLYKPLAGGLVCSAMAAKPTQVKLTGKRYVFSGRGLPEAQFRQYSILPSPDVSEAFIETIARMDQVRHRR